jgi:hypothetical protein
MLGAILRGVGSAAADALTAGSTSEQKVKTAIATPVAELIRRELIQTVSDDMWQWELESIEKCEATILGLYLHFFWSIFVLIECSIWFSLYSALYLTLSAMYYLERLASCGKGCTKDTTDWWERVFTNMRNSWLYYYTSWVFVLGNIVIPWMPPLYFYKRYDQVTYPNPQKARTSYLKLTKQKRQDPSGLLHCLTCCCTCCLDDEDCYCSCTGVDSGHIPAWMKVQAHFYTVGGTAACCPREENFESRASQFYLENTRRFYRETYSDVSSFQELFEAKCRERGVPVPSTPAPPPKVNSTPTAASAVSPPNAPVTATAVGIPVEPLQAEVIRTGGSVDKV